MVFSRNPEYHGRFTGNVQRVELSLPTDRSSLLEMYEADSLDILYLLAGVLPPEKERVRQQYAGEYVSGPWLQTVYVGFDVSRPPFDDPRVRRAFLLATDRETLAGLAMRGYEFPATGGFVPPGMPGHSAGIALPYDPDRATQLLTEAGYPGGHGFPDIALFGGRDIVGEYLQVHWQENLGVEITWETMEWAMFLNRLDKAPPHMFLIGWPAYYPDPDSFLRVCPARRWARWHNDVYDRLVEEARRITDQEERIRMYQEVDRILVEEAAIIPLIYGRLNLLIKPWVRKFPVSAIKQWFWKDVIIDPH